MSDPNQLDDTLLSASNDADDMATIRVPKPAASAMPDDLQTLIVAKSAASPTQAALEALSPMGANPAAPVPFIFGRRIAKGGMGAILEASDCKLGRTIAVKVMLSEAGCSEEQKQRFIQEAAVLARLAHPNIVPVYDLGLDAEGELFYTMKLVKGRTLQHILDELRREHPEDLREFTLDRLLTIFRKVCDALAFAHAQKIIHRDLKPENIMVGEFGEVLVMDWGIAKILDGSADTLVRSDSDPISGQAAEPRSESPRSSTASFTATMDGAVMGTPNYMSPEQAMGKVNELDERSDIFSLGGILYAILTLRPPVEGKDVWEVLEKVQMANITAPTSFGVVTNGKGKTGAKGEVVEAKKIKPLPHMPGGRVPPALSAVAMKALTLDKTKRYQAVAAFSADIEKFQGGFATSAENAGAWKQLMLLTKRHKAAAFGIAAVLLVGATLGTKALIEGRRAEDALTHLRKTAPALLQLAASEAAVQRFDSALDKVDAALSLDPRLTAAHWRRGWILVGQDKLPEAIAALRDAARLDPQNHRFAALLPMVEKMAAATADTRHAESIAMPIYNHLSAVNATGEATPFIRHLKQTSQQRLTLVRERLKQWLGDASFKVGLAQDTVSVEIDGQRVGSLEPLRGLPIGRLIASGCDLESLEPLRGMHLTLLHVLNNPKLDDLTPLRGMPLEHLRVDFAKITDLSPLAGMPLRELQLPSTVPHAIDLSPLAGMPLQDLRITCRTADFSVLKGMPLHIAQLWDETFTDLTVLQGAPLEHLKLTGKVTNLAPLVGTPLQRLDLGKYAGSDLRPLLDIPTLESFSIIDPPPMEKLLPLLLPLRAHPSLKTIKCNAQGSRPVAEFWADYDKQQAAGK